MKHSLKIKLAPLALIAVAAMWGATFVLMKDSISRQPINDFLFTRFSLATLILILLRPKALTLINRDLALRGVGAGSFLGLGFIFQTYGLSNTTAAITGFVTGLYVVLTPLIAALILHRKVTGKAWIAVAIATIGLTCLSFQGFSINFGAFLVLICVIFFSAHIIALGEWSAGRDTYAMTITQLATCSAITGVASIPGGYVSPPDKGVWGVVIFCAVFATAFAFIIQTWAQSVMSPTTVAVLITNESVFAALFAVWFGGEILTPKIIIGGILVLISMYLIVLTEK